MSGKANPYERFPSRAFWSQSVTRGWNPVDIFVGADALLRPSDHIVSAGSCFAGNIVPFLESAGYDYVRTEHIEDADARFGYGIYSAGYGNIYSVRQMLQLVLRCKGEYHPAENKWLSKEGVVDPFRPGMPFPPQDEAEFDLITASHLEMTRSAFERASVFIFTLGLTEAWISCADGAVFPACPGTVAGTFDASLHKFVNFQAPDVIADLKETILAVRTLNPTIRVILTVSPVPLVATATGGHVYSANFFSKSVLRAACGFIENELENVVYFPALEIVLGIGAGKHFREDLRNINELGLRSVLNTLFAHCILPDSAGRRNKSIGGELSQRLARYECEETFSDPYEPGRSN